jgi:plasmid stabilization system protein ParE
MATRLYTAAEGLAEFPERGRPVRLGRRELTVVPPYLIIYRLHVDLVEILTVRPVARNRGPA